MTSAYPGQCFAHETTSSEVVEQDLVDLPKDHFKVELVWAAAEDLAWKIAEDLGWNPQEEPAFGLAEQIALSITEAVNDFIEEVEIEEVT